MDLAKIALSKVEMELVRDPDWILTKNAVMLKARHLLGEVLLLQQEILSARNFNIPTEVLSYSPKISKGENYKGLPYLILDHPRCFDREKVFAIRTFFWWGHFFSVTLHLSGVYKQAHAKYISSAHREISENEIYINTNDSEWEHDLECTDYILAKDMTDAKWKMHLEQASFIKLARKHSLEAWEEAPRRLAGDFSLLLGLIDD